MSTSPASKSATFFQARREKFHVAPYYKASWAVARAAPILVGARIAADVFARIVALGAGFSLVTLLVINYQAFQETGAGLAPWLITLASTLSSPAFLVGLSGVIFTLWLTTVVVDALAMGGIWGTFAARLRGEEIHPYKTFLEHTLARLPAVIGLSILSLAIRAGLVLLGVTVFTSIWYGTREPGMLFELGLWSKASIWAGGLATYLLFAGLVRLTLEVVAAPLIVEGHSLGEAILRAAHFVAEHFLEIYRIFVFMLALLLVPLAGYWVVLMLQNITLVVPSLTPAMLVLRFVAEVLLFASLAGLGVLFHGAVFSFYAQSNGATLESPSQPKDRDMSEESNDKTNLRARIAAARPNSAAMNAGITLADMVPSTNENRASYQDVFGEEFVASLKPAEDQGPESSDSDPQESNEDVSPDRDPDPAPESQD